MNFLGLELKKCNPDMLDGRLTVYAKIDLEPEELLTIKHPIAQVVHNGLLVAQGNFKEQSNLRDFLKSEMGMSLEDGLEEIIGRLDGLESALDPQKLREKIESMKDFEDLIPTPAKIVPFHSEQEILAQEGDVVFSGHFKQIGNANLTVNAFPIFYQARYREQQINRVQNEIESLISQIERGEAPRQETFASISQDDVDERILKEYIPHMLYSRKKPEQFDAAQEKFRNFMSGYRFPGDVDTIIGIIGHNEELHEAEYKLLELVSRKIKEVISENFIEVDRLKGEIDKLTKE
ncbi:MAG: hypothetical protein GF398_12935 [Chitinivibrionales bacterium]|nr:hypothetical protein [Chitinivibrionales bacterium]